MDAKALSTFQSYLRIRTVQPNPDYPGAVAFLREQAAELELPVDVVEVHPGRPVVVMKWCGLQPNLPSVMLNSHIDVVPVFPEFWKHDPFEAVMDEKGDIYARGSQDMKCVGVQYMEAVRRLKAEGYQPERTMYLTFVPDEEIGGALGMKLFVEHDYFKSMDVGFAMDEGLASPTEEYPVFYGERNVWWVQVTCRGQPGHGSQFLENTAGVKIRQIIDRFMDFRESEKRRLESDPKLTLGDTVTVNLTKLDGGVQYNVVPAELTVGFDVRVPPHWDFDDLEGRFRQWAEDAGSDIEIKYLRISHNRQLTIIDSEKSPWWAAFEAVAKQLKMTLRPQIFPAGTDCKFIRPLGIQALGFSPMNKTPVLLHDHNEFLNRDVFLRGVEFYKCLIPALASVKDA